MYRFGTVLALAIVCGVIAVPLGVPAVPIGSSDILVFQVGPPSASLLLGGDATFVWVAYNNGSSSYLLEATPPTNGTLTFVSTVTQLVLKPAESAEIRLHVQAPRYGMRQSIDLSMQFDVTNLVTGSRDATAFSLQIALLGVTEAHDPQGKILGAFPNPLPSPLDNEWAAFAITVGFWFSVGAVLLYGIVPIVRRAARRTRSRLDDLILAIIRGPIILLFALFGVVNSLAILGLPPEWRDVLGRVYGFGFALLLTWLAYRLFRDLLIAYGHDLAKRTSSDLDDRLLPALDKIGAVVIVALGIMIAIQGLGYDITLFLAGIGVVGLIIAFAAQDTLGNFFAGVHLMLDRPFRKGDLIQLETGEICEVRDIGLRSTKLYWGKGNVLLILPNNKVAGTKIVNFNRPDLPFKVHVPFGVAYDSDITRVRKVLVDIANTNPDILLDADHPSAFQVDEFADSAVLVRLIFWIRSPRDQWRVASEVRETILRRFREEGIDIPFPQRVVWSGDRGGEKPPQA